METESREYSCRKTEQLIANSQTTSVSRLMGACKLHTLTKGDASGKNDFCLPLYYLSQYIYTRILLESIHTYTYIHAYYLSQYIHTLAWYKTGNKIDVHYFVVAHHRNKYCINEHHWHGR